MIMFISLIFRYGVTGIIILRKAIRPETGKAIDFTLIISLMLKKTHLET